MKKLIASTLFASALLFSAPSSAASIGKYFDLRAGAVMTITGTIVPGDALRVAETLAAYERAKTPIKLFQLSSDGGDLNEGFIIAELVGKFGFPTYVPPYAECSSACALIFFSGPNAYLSEHARIGVHQASEGGKITAASKRATEEIALALVDAGVPDSVIAKMNRTKAPDVTILGRKDLNAFWIHFTEEPPLVGTLAPITKPAVKPAPAEIGANP
jgi:hypothetical protein